MLLLWTLACSTPDETGDTGPLPDTADTADSADTADTAETGDTDTAPPNNPPGAAEVGISPATPAPGVDFAAVVVTPAVDPDGDEVLYRYAWSRNGTAEAHAEAVVPGAMVVDGDTWVVEVTPHDGVDDGPIATATATVGNAAPTAPEISILPAEPVEGDDLVLTIDVPAVDPDGDVVTTTITWNKNGTYTSWFDGLTTIEGKWVGDQDQFEAVVSVTDGLHAPTEVRASVTAAYTCANPPPEALATANLTDARAYHGIGFDDADATLIGWDGSALLKSEYSGSRSLFVPGVSSAEQIDRLPDGDWVYADNYTGTLVRVDPSGATSVAATGLGYVYGVTTGPDGMVYVTYGSVTRVDPDTGEKTTIVDALGGETAHAVNFNLDSTVMYIATIGSGTVYEVPLDANLDPTGAPTAFATGMGSWMDGLELDECGNLYIPNYSDSMLWRVDPSGTTNTRMVTANSTLYGHGVTWGNGAGDWDALTLYQPQPYTGSTVREVRIGFASGDTVRTWNGVAAPW